jgi:ubiquitin carboxyl-terminal hydrolase 36/42
LQHGPRYALYAVISHAGGGPNSGHYYAHVKGPDGSWYDANDESVIRTTSSTVVGRKNAYMLFYMRMQGDALGAAINLHGANGLKKGMKRETHKDDDEDRGVAANGTAAPASSPLQQQKPALDKPSPLAPRPDPQAVKLQERIAKVSAHNRAPLRSNVSLVPYSSDGEEEEQGEGREATPAPEKCSPPSLPPSSSSVVPGASSSSPIKPSSFYGDSQLPKKRKSFGGSDDDADRSTNEVKRHRSSPPSETQRRDKQQLVKRAPGTPFTSSTMSNNLHEARGGPGQEQGHGFNPPRRGPPQQIANVGHKVFHPKGSKFAARMKPRTRTMI